jgi:aminopeptidase N
MLHMIRQIVDDDVKWRGILRGLNRTFRHQTVTGRQVQAYMSREAGVDLGRVFEQYLTTTRIPELQYRVEDTTLAYRWANVVTGFDMQVAVMVPGLGTRVLHPTEAWQTLAVPSARAVDLTVDENYYVTLRNVGREGAGR